LLKAIDDGLTEADAVAALVPVPDRDTLWDELVALSLMMSVPVRVPAVVGVKVTLMVQVDPTASVLPQVLVCAKSPLMLIPVTVRLAVPELLNVTALAAVVEPTTSLPKERADFDKSATLEEVVLEAEDEDEEEEVEDCGPPPHPTRAIHKTTSRPNHP
jgi:hypothetical protein